MYEGPEVHPDDVISIYVVLNGTLGMSPGKCASQAFHCGYMVGVEAEEEAQFEWHEYAPVSIYSPWKQQGRRVVVRVAETETVFNRVMEECRGQAQQDEGLTEVEHGAITAYVTIPYRRADAPKVLQHKKCQLYTEG